MVIILVAMGAGIGAVLRYLITLAGKRYWPELPLATLIVNALGALIAGFLGGIQLGGLGAALLLTGLCGGFTTFSTFTVDTFVLVRNKRWSVALEYYFGSILLGCLAVYIGLYVGQLVGN